MIDTPARRQFDTWLAAFNRGDRAAFQRFLAASLPSRAQDLDQEMAFREMTGGFVLHKIEASTTTRLVALVEERLSDQFGRLTLEVEVGEPHVITRLDVDAIPRPPEFPLPHLDEAVLLAALSHKLDDDVAADRFAGAVLLARDGKVVFARADGLADRERRIYNTTATRFRLGSMNKMFTATAILQLVQAGKVGLDDPLVKHLPDYPNQDLARKVTIRHLLTHTGGTGDIFGRDFDAHRPELRTLADYVALYGKRSLDFVPGSRWAYINYGFILLGRVIDEVSGQSYYEYVDAHIFRPSGMTATGSEPEDQPVADRSVGYTRMNGSWRPNNDSLPYRGTSAGGGYSTVVDLLRFATALQSTLLDALHTELLTTGKVDTPGGRYAFGFTDHIVNGTRCFGHGGGAPGMNGRLEICPGYVIAVLANLDPMAADRVASFIINRLPRQPK